MSKTIRDALLCAALSLAWFVVCIPAYAASYLDEAVQALQSGNVYVSLEVSNISSTTKEQLLRQTSGSNIAVVALPPAAAGETGGNTSEFVAEIAERSGYDTVVVAFGNDLQAGSRPLKPGVAQQLADKAESGSGPVGDDLLSFVSEVKAETGNSSPASSGSNSVGIMPVLLIVAIIVALVALVIGLVRSRLRSQVPAQALPKLTVDGELRTGLEKMRQMTLQINGNQELQQNALTAANETDELFVEIRKVLPDRINEKMAEFTNHVNRVNRILETYIKAQNKPRHFEDADKVKQDTGRSIVSYGENVHRNLIRVGESELLDFEVDVRMLTQPTYRPNLEK